MKITKNEALRKDILTKLAVFLTAIFLWSYVMSDTDPEITQEYKNITVSYTNEASLNRDNLIIMEPMEIKIDVKVNGKRSDLKKFNATRINAKVDLSGHSEGERKIPIEVSLMNQRSGVKIVDFEPREALFVMDKIVTKEVPVEVNYRGNVAEGYVVGNPTVKPQSVLVSGPRSWLNEVVKAQVAIDLTNKKKDTNISAPVRIINDMSEEVIGIDKEPDIIDIMLPILITKEVSIKIDLMDNTPDGYEVSDIQVEPEVITIKGPRDMMDISEIKTKKIDMNLFLNNGFTNVALDLPEGVSLLNPNEEIKITYTVNEIAEKVIEIPKSIIDLQNPRSGYIYNVDREGKMSVNIRGHKEIVESLKVEDILPFVDVSMIDVGTHMVSLQFEEIKHIRITPIEVTAVETKINTK